MADEDRHRNLQEQNKIKLYKIKFSNDLAELLSPIVIAAGTNGPSKAEQKYTLRK